MAKYAMLKRRKRKPKGQPPTRASRRLLTLPPDDPNDPNKSGLGGALDPAIAANQYNVDRSDPQTRRNIKEQARAAQEGGAMRARLEHERVNTPRAQQRLSPRTQGGADRRAAVWVVGREKIMELVDRETGLNILLSDWNSGMYFQRDYRLHYFEELNVYLGSKGTQNLRRVVMNPLMRPRVRRINIRPSRTPWPASNFRGKRSHYETRLEDQLRQLPDLVVDISALADPEWRSLPGTLPGNNLDAQTVQNQLQVQEDITRRIIWMLQRHPTGCREIIAGGAETETPAARADRPGAFDCDYFTGAFEYIHSTTTRPVPFLLTQCGPIVPPSGLYTVRSLSLKVGFKWPAHRNIGDPGKGLGVFLTDGRALETLRLEISDLLTPPTRSTKQADRVLQSIRHAVTDARWNTLPNGQQRTFPSNVSRLSLEVTPHTAIAWTHLGEFLLELDPAPGHPLRHLEFSIAVRSAKQIERLADCLGRLFEPGKPDRETFKLELIWFEDVLDHVVGRVIKRRRTKYWQYGRTGPQLRWPNVESSLRRLAETCKGKIEGW